MSPGPGLMAATRRPPPCTNAWHWAPQLVPRPVLIDEGGSIWNAASGRRRTWAGPTHSPSRMSGENPALQQVCSSLKKTLQLGLPGLPEVVTPDSKFPLTVSLEARVPWPYRTALKRRGAQPRKELLLSFAPLGFCTSGCGALPKTLAGVTFALNSLAATFTAGNVFSFMSYLKPQTASITVSYY